MLDLYERKVYEKQGNNPLFKQVSQLRLDFVDRAVLKVNTESYSTQVERDYAYLVKREYKYKVTADALAKSFFAGTLGIIAGTFYKRKLNVLPSLICLPVFYYYYQQNRVIFNKRFFDMCNVGEEFDLGRQRNVVLRECNRLQDVEDF